MARRQDSAITLRDVARAAGVSDITVSRVLRQSGPISAPTRERVMRAVSETGYVHNRLAGALASARTSLVGVVLPSLSNNVFPEVMAGIDGALARSGFQPVVGVTDYDEAAEEALVRSMLAWKPAAMIVSGLDHTRATTRLLEDARLRIVEIMDVDGRPIDVAIGFSHREAGIATGQHLLKRGYRRFGYVGHNLAKDRRAEQRRRSFSDFLRREGCEAPIEHLVPGPSSIRNGRAGLAALLQTAGDLDVVVFSNDDMAVGGVFHCLANGIAPKADLGLFGFNGLDIGQALPCPLSTIRSNRHRIGQIAVETLMRDPARPASRTVIDTGFEIVAGETA